MDAKDGDVQGGVKEHAHQDAAAGLVVEHGHDDRNKGDRRDV